MIGAFMRASSAARRGSPIRRCRVTHKNGRLILQWRQFREPVSKLADGEVAGAGDMPERSYECVCAAHVDGRATTLTRILGEVGYLNPAERGRLAQAANEPWQKSDAGRAEQGTGNEQQGRQGKEQDMGDRRPGSEVAYRLFDEGRIDAVALKNEQCCGTDQQQRQQDSEHGLAAG